MKQLQTNNKQEKSENQKQQTRELKTNTHKQNTEYLASQKKPTRPRIITALIHAKEAPVRFEPPN